MNQSTVSICNRIETNGIKKLWLAEKIDKPYSTLCSWLNGYTPMPEKYAKLIDEIVKEEEANSNN